MTCVAEDEEDEYHYAAEGEACGYYDDDLGYDVECDTALTCEE